MIFFKRIFSNKENQKEDNKERLTEKEFDILKYDGIKALQVDGIDYAIQCFKYALDIQDDLEIRDHLSQAYIKSNQLSEAQEQLQKLAELQPENQQILVRMANVAYMMEDYVLMGETCEKAILIDSNNAEVTYLYALANQGQGDEVNAIALASKTISIDPEFGSAYLLRAELFLDRGEYDEADNDLSWLLSNRAESEEVLLLKAQLETQRGNKEEAIGYYGKVIDINPFSIKAYKERAELYLILGKSDKAAKDKAMLEELQSQMNIRS